MKTLLALLCLGTFASCETEYTTRTYASDYSDEDYPVYQYHYSQPYTPYYVTPYYSQYDAPYYTYSTPYYGPYYNYNRTKVVIKGGDRDRDEGRHMQKQEYRVRRHTQVPESH